MLPDERFLSLCRMQGPGTRLVPLGRGVLVTARPNVARGHSRVLGVEGLRRLNAASPRKRTRWMLVSGSGEPQPSSRAQGARGSPAPLCPTASGGLSAKTACVAFLSKGGVGLVMLGEQRFLSLCRLQPPGADLVPVGSRGLGTVQPSLARGALMGPGRRRPSHGTILLPHEVEHIGSGFQAPENPNKAAGPREPEAAQPRFARRRAAG